jgi:signal transduction histidine kinase
MTLGGMTLVRSLRFRLLAGAVLWITAALLAGGFVLSDLFRDHVEGQLKAQLLTHLDQLAATLQTSPDSGLSLAQPLSDPRFRKPYSGLYWQVSGANDATLLRSRSLWDITLTVSPDSLSNDSLSNNMHRPPLPGPAEQALIMVGRTVSLPDAPGRLHLVVATNAAEVDEVMAAFARTLALSLGVLALGLIAAAVAQVFIGLRPLHKVRAALIAVREGREKRLNGPFPAEIQPLVDDLNALLGRAAERIEHARWQAGNLAHGLKTPLAILLNEAADLADRQPESADRIRRQTALMGQRIDSHLARARAAASAEISRSHCPLGPCVDRLRRAMERLHEERAIRIVVEIPPDHQFRGECQDLEEMLGNLMDNACKWAKTQVELKSRRDGDRLVVTIDDDGPGLSKDEREAVFARGQRLDETVPGSGLGLGITRELAELYSGDVRLEDSRMGGLRAVLRLPADRRDKNG